MEWIETTGKSIEEAKEAALDELGVDEQDAEFEVLAEPKVGLFGRMRVEARVRSRVRPTAPRPKDDRRNRRRGRGGDKAGGESAEPATGAGAEMPDAAEALAAPAVPAAGGADSGAAASTSDVEDPEVSRQPSEAGGAKNGSGRRNGAANGRGTRRAAEERNEEKDRMSNVDVPLEEQAQVAQEFLAGLIEEFGLTAQIAATVGEEDVIDVTVNGADLGMLIGPKGSTLLALQDLTRSAVQQKTSAGNGRLNVDVAGYRQKRSEALARFALQVAESVKASGVRQALEPMSAVDRKVVHDALTGVEGVATVSEGEDAQRRVVVVPTSA